MKSPSLKKKALTIIDKRGRTALEEASREILQNQHDGGIVSDALNYYAKETFPSVLPLFPALISLSCEAVGGQPEKTKPLAVAMMLITASGDIHDDIIDKSTHKFGKKTLFGKYGSEVTLLAGDTLLVQGMTLFQNRCDSLSREQKQAISGLICKSMFEIAKAEAIETRLWKKANVTPQEYFEVIRLKGSIAEAQCRIGGILGDADEKSLDSIAHFGRVIGILSTMMDEFMDILNFSELQHRIKNELPPYPMICAFENEVLKKQINLIISKAEFLRKDAKVVAEKILNSEEAHNLKVELKELVENELKNNFLLKKNKRGKELIILLQALAESVDK